MNLGTTGLILVGCGSKGICQQGSLKAIKELGIPIDNMFTSSAGTLNGLFYAMGEIEQLEELWLNIHTKDVYSKSPLDRLNMLTDKAALYDNSALLKTIQKNVNVDKVRSFKGNFFINTTDLTNYKALTYESAQLSDDELLLYAYASATPPIFFPPVPFRDVMLTDSGISNNYSIVSAINQGCDTLIVVSPSIMEVHKPHNIIDMVKSVMTISMQTYLPRELKAVERVNTIIDEADEHLPSNLDLRKINVVLIQPDKPLDFDFLDFEFTGHDRKELLQYGYSIAIDKLKALV